MTDVLDVHNPVDLEHRIEEISNRIAKGVEIVTKAEREAARLRRDFDLAYALAYKRSEGAAHVKKYEADIMTMPHRERAENAEITFRHAQRTARALEKELAAWQSINTNVRTMFGAVRA